MSILTGRARKGAGLAGILGTLADKGDWKAPSFAIRTCADEAPATTTDDTVTQPLAHGAEVG